MPQDPNNVIFLIFISLIVYTLLSCATGMTVFRQIFVLRQHVLSQRMLYRKRAIQALELTLVINIILFLASFIDFFIAKVIFAKIGEELYFLAPFIPAFLLATIIFLILWLRALKRTEEAKIFWPFALITSFTSIKTMSIFLILVFRLFYTAPAEVLPFFAVVEGSNFAWLFVFYNKLFSAMLPFVNAPLLSAFVLLFFLSSGGAIASAFQMLYTLLCRKIDDFGRDYYAQTIIVLSKAGFRASLLLTILIIAAIITNMVQVTLIPLALDSTSLLLLFIPLALVNFILIALSKNPLRFKISISTSPIFLLVGVFFFIVQTLQPTPPLVEKIENVKQVAPVVESIEDADSNAQPENVEDVEDVEKIDSNLDSTEK